MKLIVGALLFSIAITSMQHMAIAQDAPSGTILQPTAEKDNVLFHSGEQKFLHNDPAGAIQDFDQALAINPKLGQALYLRCACKHMLHNYQGAIADCSKALEIKPNDPVLYMQIGMAEYRLGMFDKCIEHCTKGIAAKATYSPNYVYRGFARIETGDLKGAIEDSETALKLAPDDVNSLALGRRIKKVSGQAN